MSKHKHYKHYYKLLSIIKEKDEEIAELKKHFGTTRTTILHQPSANSLLRKNIKKERRADGNNKDERRSLAEGMKMI